LRPKSKSGLVQALKILKDVKGISVVNFDERDIIRHHLVKYIVNAYKKLDTENGSNNENNENNK
jgi:phosphate starvation-inducible PhoH-like protein